jgi:uncharacterized membrane protein YgcG
MKKLWLSIVFVLLALTLSAQKKSNYEKYWQAREDSIKKSQAVNTESQVQRVDQEDTLQAIVDTVVKYNPDVQVNYFQYDPFYYSYNLGRFYHGGLNYWMYTDPWFYNNYWMMDNYNWNWEMGFMGNSFWNPWYYDNYGFGFGYYGWGNNWYGHRFNHNHNDWFTHHNQNHPYNNWYTHHNQNWNRDNHGFTKYRQEQSSSANMKHSIRPENKAVYSESRRSYNPSYNNPRMTTRPAYNNSRVTTGSVNRRVQTNNNSRTESRTYSQPNMQRNNTSARTYSQPSRSSNYSPSRSSNYSVPSRNSVSQPSRSYNNSNSGSYSNSRSSSYGGSNYSSGSRSSGSSGGGSSSGNGGSRSSGGGSGRR